MKRPDQVQVASVARFDRLRTSVTPCPAVRVESRIRLRCGPRTFFLRPSSIEWIEAAGNYSTVSVQETAFLVREQIGDLSRRLPPPLLRIHRSVLVNVERVVEIRRTGRKTWAAVLTGGKILPLAEEYRELLEENLMTS